MTIDYVNMSNEDLLKNITTIGETAAEETTTTSQLKAPNDLQNINNPSNSAEREQRENSRHEETAKTIHKVYSHHSLAELVSTPAPIEYFIDGFIQKGATHMLFGDPGCKKTFAAIDIGLSIACEEIDSWCYMKIEHGPVIYLAGEGANGLRKRCKTWLMKHNVTPESIPFTVIDECFHLNDDKNPDYSIENTIDNIRAIYEHPALIIVDTLHRFYEGSENDSQDMGKYIYACEQLTRAFNCGTLTIHHTGNAQENKGRARGSSSFRGAIDIEIKAEAFGDSLHLDQTKNKDAKKITGLILDFEEVTLPPEWNRKNGEPETSLVPKYSPYNNPNKFSASEDNTTHKLTAKQQRARETYEEAAKKFGIRIHDEETDHDFVAVHIEDWRKVYYELSSANNPNTKRKNFSLDRQEIYENEELLIKRVFEGDDYYCLDLQAEGEERLRTIIACALGKRARDAGGAYRDSHGVKKAEEK